MPTRTFIFWSRGSGLAMETLGGGNAGPADPGQTFQETLHVEGNRYPLLLPSMDPAGDIWFWDYVDRRRRRQVFPDPGSRCRWNRQSR